ncbi:MAG: hypothetical protein GX613_16945 [Chloroflexi bacterium]|nr:hypothetical protein [Chloroflexota bacterium]
MTCQLPPPLSDDEISAVVDGTADDDVIRHVADCPHCAARVATARQLERTLARRLSRWDCPPPLALGEYHLNLLSKQDAKAVREHIAGCPRCEAELSDLAIFLENGVRNGAKTSQPAEKRSRFGKLRLPDMLMGTVQTQRPALALRGTGDDPVIVEAGGLTVFLKLEPRAGEPVLLGQLAGDDLEPWVGALVEVWQDGALRSTAEVDDLGSFRCETIALQPFELQILARGGATILVPEIHLAE